MDQPLANSPAVALQALQSVLKRLDHRLQAAIAAAADLYGPHAAADPNRGLYICEEDLQALWSRPVGEPLFPSQGPFSPTEPGARLVALQQRFQLSAFELDLLVVALAPELDLRYERIYAYLQDDVTRKRPTVDLALNLLCQSFIDKLEKRQHLASPAALIEHQLLHLVADPGQPEPPFLAQFLVVDRRIVEYLLGNVDLDSRLRSFCQFEDTPCPWFNVPVEETVQTALRAHMSRASSLGQPFRLYLQGLPGLGQWQMAAAIATDLKTPLLAADLSQATSPSIDWPDTLRLMLREAQLHSASLYLAGVESLMVQEPSLTLWLGNLLQRFPGAVILSGQRPWGQISGFKPPPPTISLPLPESPARRRYWQRSLTSVDVVLQGGELERLADQFRLTPEQIDGAVVLARHGVQGQTPLTLTDLIAAARQQSAQELASLAQKLSPKYQWEDMVLPPDQVEQLQEACHQARYRDRVYREWGFGEKLSRGKGLAMLFTGPPGTGKTMAAEVIANELHLDLYRIDLSQVVSKYIGETEKNLDRIFTAAQTANAILFFDEADALFGKRSEVKDAHDRYANIEVGYLLQKMEDYEGITILASNLRQNMDDAFVRRIQMMVEFPFPDEDSRHRIWQVTFPPAVPLAEDVDLALLAREVKLAGGNIKNIALAAAFSAASEGGQIKLAHLVKAAQREHQKLGRRWSLG